MTTLDTLPIDLTTQLNSIKSKITALWLACKCNDIAFAEYRPNEPEDWYHCLYVNHAQIYIYKLDPYSIYGYIGVNNGDSEFLWRLNNKQFNEVWFTRTENSEWEWAIKEWDKDSRVYI
jgi:hypothetical protein